MNIFYWGLVLIHQVFAETLTTFGFRFRIPSGVNILLDTNTRILMIAEIRNEDFIENLDIISYQHKWQCSTVFFQLLACFCNSLVLLSLNCLFFQNIEISDNRYFEKVIILTKIKYSYKMGNFKPSSISCLTYCLIANAIKVW